MRQSSFTPLYLNQDRFDETLRKREELFCFLFRGDELLGRDTTPYAEFGVISANGGYTPSPSALVSGQLNGVICVCDQGPENPPDGWSYRSFRDWAPHLDHAAFSAVARAIQLYNFRLSHRFCGFCGGATYPHPLENSMVCDHCGQLFYPRIAPAIIVLITRGEEILLAHNRNFRNNFYSLVAGFVESGETLEECVHREVNEEVGIEIDNLCYFCSQPWPMPHSLMLAFQAEYLSGEIQVDGEEIDDAGWFSRENLPPIPGPGSVANRLITTWIERKR